MILVLTMRQVVTGADDSSVAVWDLESGAKSMLFTNTHGQEEITCMTFDSSWRRLFTGARDGTIKVKVRISFILNCHGQVWLIFNLPLQDFFG